MIEISIPDFNAKSACSITHFQVVQDASVLTLGFNTPAVPTGAIGDTELQCSKTWLGHCMVDKKDELFVIDIFFTLDTLTGKLRVRSELWMNDSSVPAIDLKLCGLIYSVNEIRQPI